MKRTRAPDAFASGGFEVNALHDHLAGDDEEQAADQNEEQFGAGENGKGSEGPAESERPGVAHMDLGWRGVPPQKADERADDRRRDHRDIERAGDGVALEQVGNLNFRAETGLVGLPKSDDDIGADREN